MYTTGFIKLTHPQVLINPKEFNSFDSLCTWLNLFFNEDDFKLDIPLSEEYVRKNLLENAPLQINIAGYDIALLISRQVILDQLDFDYIFADLNI